MYNLSFGVCNESHYKPSLVLKETSITQKQKLAETETAITETQRQKLKETETCRDRNRNSKTKLKNSGIHKQKQKLRDILLTDLASLNITYNIKHSSDGILLILQEAETSIIIFHDEFLFHNPRMARYLPIQVHDRLQKAPKRQETTAPVNNQSELVIRSRDWISANQGPVFPPTTANGQISI
eukprot:sb/3471538/